MTWRSGLTLALLLGALLTGWSVLRHHAQRTAGAGADASFRSGDEVMGFRWIKVFRLIAASHIRREWERLGRLSDRLLDG
jgi:hypothetical protein